ncbi:MAG: DegT/DnrJ/EryC1/StrS family aminotransferase [Chloroflexi bacterium]|nr:DegT/DnrJ/EryC1/StrS family aminotransferase [Chloroflexota bacterium]
MTAIPLVDLRTQYRALRGEIVPALEAVLDSMHLMLGPNVLAFETEFANHVGAAHAIGVGSGTDALYLALRACGVGAGDEVITVAHTFFATAEAILDLGAVPVLVDVDRTSYTLDPARLDAAITPRTRAIVPVHLYGGMADMDTILAIARRRGLAVVEDACQAHGARDRGRRAGSIGDAAAFSFYVSKNLAAYGEAGAVTTSSPKIAERVRQLRDHGATEKYRHAESGRNSRLDELQAAVLRVKLRHLDAWNVRRRALAREYDALLDGSGVMAPVVRRGVEHVFHLYVVEVEADARDRVRASLSARGIETGIHYPVPLHRQPALQSGVRISGSLAQTEDVVGRIISLPMYPELQPEQVQQIADCLRASVEDAAAGLAV